MAPAANPFHGASLTTTRGWLLLAVVWSAVVVLMRSAYSHARTNGDGCRRPRPRKVVVSDDALEREALWFFDFEGARFFFLFFLEVSSSSRFVVVRRR